MALLIPFDGKTPRVHPSAFLAPTAVLIGDVTVDEESSIWFGAVLRADFGAIRIGKRSSIQENVSVHVYPGSQTVVGDDVTVGHNAVLHDCQIGDGCLVGMGVVVLQHVTIGAHSLVAAGAVVTDNTQVPPNTLVAGIPAKPAKSIEGRSAEWLESSASGYVELARRYKEARIDRLVISSQNQSSS